MVIHSRCVDCLPITFEQTLMAFSPLIALAILGVCVVVYLEWRGRR